MITFEDVLARYGLEVPSGSLEKAKDIVLQKLEHWKGHGMAPICDLDEIQSKESTHRVVQELRTVAVILYCQLRALEETEPAKLYASLLAQMEEGQRREEVLRKRAEELEAQLDAPVDVTKAKQRTVEYLRWEVDRLTVGNKRLRRDNKALREAVDQLTRDPVDEDVPKKAEEPAEKVAEPTVTRAPALPKCKVSGKRRFTSEKRAKKARTRSTHDRLRVYQCPYCRDWHLTRAV